MNNPLSCKNRRTHSCLVNMISLLLLSPLLLGANEHKRPRQLDFVDSKLYALGITSDLKGYLRSALTEAIAQGQASGVSAALKALFGENLDRVVDMQTQRTPLEWLALKLSEPEPGFDLGSQDKFAHTILQRSFHLLRPQEALHVVRAIAIFASAWYPQSTQFLVQQTPDPVIPLGGSINLDLMARPNPYTNRSINPEISQILLLFQSRPYYRTLLNRNRLFLSFVNYSWYEKTPQSIDLLIRAPQEVLSNRLSARDRNLNNALHLFVGQAQGSRGEDETIFSILVAAPLLHRSTNIHGQTAFEQHSYSRLPLLLLTQPDIGIDHNHPLALRTVLETFFYQSPHGIYLPIDDLSRPFAAWFDGPEMAPRLRVRFALALFNALHILNLQTVLGHNEEETKAFAQKLREAWPQGIATDESQFAESLQSIKSSTFLEYFLFINLMQKLSILSFNQSYLASQKNVVSNNIRPAASKTLMHLGTLDSLEDYIDQRLKFDLNVPEDIVQKAELKMSAMALNLLRSQFNNQIFVAAAEIEAAQKEALALSQDSLSEFLYRETLEIILDQNFPGKHRLFRMEQSLRYMTELSRILKKAKNSLAQKSQDLYSYLPRVLVLTEAFRKALYTEQQKHCQIVGFDRPQGTEESDLWQGIGQLSGDTFGHLRHCLGAQNAEIPN